VRHLYLYVASDLYEHVQRAATTAVVKVAPWLRHMVRQVTITDFPASWQEERLEGRSHDSHVYDKRYMIRLDDMTWEKLEDFSRHFDTSAAAIIRQLVAQATIEDFPQAWQMADDPRRAHPRREAIHTKETLMTAKIATSFTVRLIAWLVFLIAILWSTDVLAVAVGNYVELKATHQDGVPLHQEPRGMNGFQRIPDAHEPK